MQKLLITDSDPAFCQALAAALETDFQVLYCSEGDAALQTALRVCPDLMVLDLNLPGLDGVTLLQKLRSASVSTLVLVTTVLTSRYVIRRLQNLDVQYLVRKPCTVEVIERHVRTLSQLYTSISKPLPELHNQVSDVLMRMGIPTKLHGHSYIAAGILLMLHHPDIRVTKELYPHIGQLYQSNGTLVERSIRNAIRIGWEQRDPAVWQIYFPEGLPGSDTRPTNRVFLSRMADCLRRSLQFPTPEAEQKCPPSPETEAK